MLVSGRSTVRRTGGGCFENVGESVNIHGNLSTAAMAATTHHRIDRLAVEVEGRRAGKIGRDDVTTVNVRPADIAGPEIGAGTRAGRRSKKDRSVFIVWRSRQGGHGQEQRQDAEQKS